ILETLGSGLFGRASCLGPCASGLFSLRRKLTSWRHTGVLKGPLFNSAGESGRTGAFDEGARWRPGRLFDNPD
ncbi:hypothetical protein BJX63DRAFT_391490, partial [Aspergillus granulosus]